jgi:hypothetical protein
MIKFLIIFIILMQVGTISAFSAQSNKGISRIQADYESGKVSFEYQLIQKYYYLFNQSKLATKYIDLNFTPVKCGTEIVKEFIDHKKELSKSAIDEINFYLNSPFEKTSTSAVYVTPSGRFELTYDISGANAVPLADTNGNGIPDYVEWVGSYFDYAWHFEIDSLKYLAPSLDSGKYQVSFESMNDYGYTEPINGKVTRIVLNNNFFGFPPNTDPEGIQKGAAKVTAAHEFKHATQIMYNNWNEPVWFLEMDATWMEDIVYNQVNDYYNYLPVSQIAEPGRSFDRGQGYEDCIWMHYLSQRFGVLINRQIWERRAISSELIYSNFDQILAQYSFNFIKGYKEYFTWNYACGTNTSPLIRSYTEAANYTTSNICSKKSIPDSSSGCGNTELSASYFYYTSTNSDSSVKFNYYSNSKADQSLEFIILYKNNTEEVIDTIDNAKDSMSYVLTPKLKDISSIIAIPIFTTMISGNYNNSLKGYPYLPEVIVKKIPQEFLLEQNFPNPFNPNTKIRYSIPSAAKVELRIYDILGREKTVLVNEFEPEGKYEVEFSLTGNNLSSGVYFYKLTAGNFSSVKKLIILK